MGTPWQVHQFGSRGLIILFPIVLLGQQFGQLPLPSRSHSFPALCSHHPLSHGSWSGGWKFGDYYGQTWVLTSKLSHLSGL